MKNSFLSLISFLLLLVASCSRENLVPNEEADAAFQQGRSFLKVGKEEEALDDFLGVTRRTLECPKSHVEAGRLSLTLESRKDPVAAIYHFRRFLLLENDSREAPKVEQLIVTAEREIIRNLPGEPYSEYLDSLSLREENERLKREVSDLQARIGLPLNVKKSAAGQNNKPKVAVPPPPLVKKMAESARPRTYVVKQGDSLYAISRKLYGDSSHIDRIFQANRKSLASKNSLKLGQKLIIPALPPRP